MIVSSCVLPGQDFLFWNKASFGGGGGGDQCMRVQQFVILVNPEREITRSLPPPQASPPECSFFYFCFFPQFLFHHGKKACVPNATKTPCVTQQASIWQVLASAEPAVTLEGVDGNVAALSELRGKHWLQRPLLFFFLFREKNQYSRVHHTGRHFFFPGVFQLGYVK